MPVTERIDDTEYSLGVWHITEGADELLHGLGLSDSDREYLFGVRSDLRKRQWTAARRLTSVLVPKDSDRAYNVSISHSRLMAAVITSPSRKVGVDVQYMDENVLRFGRRVFSEIELARAESTRGKACIVEYLILLWAAKEALYKVFSGPKTEQRRLRFAEDIIIELSGYEPEGICRGFIKAGGNRKSYEIFHRELGNKTGERYQLVWTLD